MLKLVTLQSAKATQNNSMAATTQRPSYENAIRICNAEAEAGASSTYKSRTPLNNSYKSNCRPTGYNSVKCDTTGGAVYDGGFGNLANTLSKNANRNGLFDACMLKYGYEPPKRKTLLQKIFGGK